MNAKSLKLNHLLSNIHYASQGQRINLISSSNVMGLGMESDSVHRKESDPVNYFEKIVGCNLKRDMLS